MMILGVNAIIPILQMRQLRPKESELLAQGHTGTKRQYAGTQAHVVQAQLSSLPTQGSWPRVSQQEQ